MIDVPKGQGCAPCTGCLESREIMETTGKAFTNREGDRGYLADLMATGLDCRGCLLESLHSLRRPYVYISFFPLPPAGKLDCQGHPTRRTRLVLPNISRYSIHSF
jgi:hypothetical protein